MRSNTDLVIAPEAEDDIDDIYEYTRRTWNAGQADRYHGLIRDGFLRIQTFPEIGRTAFDDAAIRQYPLQHHVVLYRHDADANLVTILRIVNPRRLRG